MTATAKAKYVRVSPQKARLVVDLVRGKGVENALNVLRFSRKAVARDLYKLLWSAVANAKEKEGLRDERGLVVARAWVDPGPALKRIRPASMGRAFRVLHKTSHVTFEIGQEPGKTKKSGTAPPPVKAGAAEKKTPSAAADKAKA